LGESLYQKFDISWFIPSLVKYRKLFSKVLIASFFLPAALKIQQSPPNPLPRWLAWGLLAWELLILVIIASAWAVLGHVNIVVSAEGKIVPGSRVKQVQPLEKGLVKVLLVSEGEYVKQSQSLIELDTMLTQADIKRLEPELHGKAFVSENDYLNAEQERIQQAQDLAAERQHLKQLQAAEAKVREQIKLYEAQSIGTLLTEITDLQWQIASLITVRDIDRAKGLVQHGTEGADRLFGYADADTLDGLGGNETLYGAEGNDSLSGGEGNDRVYGDAGDDVLNGDDGRDYMYGGAGNDTLRGGAGANDYLSGDAGNDTYLFGAGDGNTTVYNYDAGADRNDMLCFLEGVDPSDVQATRSSSNLLLTVQSTGEVITVQSFFSGSRYELNAIEFADGTVWDIDTVKDLVKQGTEGVDRLYGDAGAVMLDGLGGNDYLYGTDGNDTLSGGEGDDRVYGQNGNDNVTGDAGNDYVYGDAGDDVLNGGDGRDYVYGDAGNDILRGGAGSKDYLSGDAGNDTYLFGAGDGNTTVYNYDIGADRNDVLRFLEGVDPGDVWATRYSTNLLLTLQSTGEVITVQSFFSGSRYELNAIEFADGTVWDIGTVKDLVTQGTEGVDWLYGYAGADTLDGLGGNDYLYGADGNDTLPGGEGDDRVYGQNGNDTVTGDAGNDCVYGDAGDDVLNGGDGRDYVYGGAGNDVLNGGDGRDYVYGGAGNDTLRGGPGSNDYLSGDAGNDIYLFAAGDGADTVHNYDTNAASIDVARFEDARIEDLWFSRSGINLRITVAGTDDRVTISKWYSNAHYQLDRIEVGSSVLLNSQVEQLVSAMASYSVPSGAGNVIPQDVADALQPVLVETWQTT
jgi:Ca2+-binding RTX toxin-like protein